MSNNVVLPSDFCEKYLCDNKENFKNFLIENAVFETRLLPVNLDNIIIVFGKKNGKIYIESLSYGQNNVFGIFNNKLKEYHNKIREKNNNNSQKKNNNNSQKKNNNNSQKKIEQDDEVDGDDDSISLTPYNSDTED
jgi:hypothetical protein